MIRYSTDEGPSFFNSEIDLHRSLPAKSAGSSRFAFMRNPSSYSEEKTAVCCCSGIVPKNYVWNRSPTIKIYATHSLFPAKGHQETPPEPKIF
jgi:hypothetical protein